MSESAHSPSSTFLIDEKGRLFFLYLFAYRRPFGKHGIKDWRETACRTRGACHKGNQ
jgi:hypothetical protein